MSLDPLTALGICGSGGEERQEAGVKEETGLD